MTEPRPHRLRDWMIGLGGSASERPSLLQIEEHMMGHFLKQKKWKKALEVSLSLLADLERDQTLSRDAKAVMTLYRNATFAALQDRDYSKCLELCDSLLRLDDRDVHALKYKGECLLLQGGPKAAHAADEYFERLLISLDLEDLMAPPTSSRPVKRARTGLTDLDDEARRGLAVAALNHRAEIQKSFFRNPGASLEVRIPVLIHFALC